MKTQEQPSHLLNTVQHTNSGEIIDVALPGIKGRWTLEQLANLTRENDWLKHDIERLEMEKQQLQQANNALQLEYMRITSPLYRTEKGLRQFWRSLRIQRHTANARADEEGTP